MKRTFSERFTFLYAEKKSRLESGAHKNQGFAKEQLVSAVPVRVAVNFFEIWI